MRAIVMIIFAIICLPFEIIYGIFAFFRRKKATPVNDVKSRVDKAIHRETLNSIKRKLNLIIIFLSFYTCSNAQIETHGGIEMGWKDEKLSMRKDSNILNCFDLNNIMYADLNIDFSWKFIKVKQTISNNFKIDDIIRYKPINIDYKTRITFNYKKVSIGYEHSCVHPVINNNLDLKQIYIRGGTDKIFIKIAW